MTNKEKTVKIKANKYIEGIITEGKVYEASELINGYVFKNDVGKKDYAHKSHFTDVTVADGTFRFVVNAHDFGVTPKLDWFNPTLDCADEPAIEVGSEWVNHKGNALTVEYVGKHCAVCTWNDTGKEFASPIKNHLKFYKPKLKTVTMYFYNDNGSLRAYDSPVIINFHIKPVAFTREIELP